MAGLTSVFPAMTLLRRAVIAIRARVTVWVIDRAEVISSLEVVLIR